MSVWRLEGTSSPLSTDDNITKALICWAAMRQVEGGTPFPYQQAKGADRVLLKGESNLSSAVLSVTLQSMALYLSLVLSIESLTVKVDGTPLVVKRISNESSFAFPPGSSKH